MGINVTTCCPPCLCELEDTLAVDAISGDLGVV